MVRTMGFGRLFCEVMSRVRIPYRTRLFHFGFAYKISRTKFYKDGSADENESRLFIDCAHADFADGGIAPQLRARWRRADPASAGKFATCVDAATRVRGRRLRAAKGRAADGGHAQRICAIEAGRNGRLAHDRRARRSAGDSARARGSAYRR